MSLFFLFFLFLPFFASFVARDVIHQLGNDSNINKKIREILSMFLLVYFFILLLIPILCLLFGSGYYLKYGEWLTINLDLLLQFLEINNPLRDFLLSETSLLGLQKISNWYIQLNLGWSCIFTNFIFIILVYAIDSKIL